MYIGKEDNFQKTCIKYLRAAHPRLQAIHVPNGGYRNVREAAKFKAMGVVAGVPDILIFNPVYDANRTKIIASGLAIELKVKGGKVRDTQRDFMNRLSSNGWICEVIWDLKKFESVLKEHYF